MVCGLRDWTGSGGLATSSHVSAGFSIFLKGQFYGGGLQNKEGSFGVKGCEACEADKVNGKVHLWKKIPLFEFRKFRPLLQSKPKEMSQVGTFPNISACLP